MFRFVLAAFAAIIFAGASQAGENSHVIVEGQSTIEFVRSIEACTAVDERFGGTVELVRFNIHRRYLFSVVSKYDIDARVRFFREEAKVPPECLFITRATHPEGYEVVHLVIRTGHADYLLLGWRRNGGLLTWEEVHELGGSGMFQYLKPAGMPLPARRIMNAEPSKVLGFNSAG